MEKENSDNPLSLVKKVLYSTLVAGGLAVALVGHSFLLHSCSERRNLKKDYLACTAVLEKYGTLDGVYGLRTGLPCPEVDDMYRLKIMGIIESDAGYDSGD